MPSPAPVRSGFRISGPDEPSAIYAHPPLVESWLSVEFPENTPSFVSNAEIIRKALGPEWLGPLPKSSESAVAGSVQLTNVMGDRALRLTAHGFAFGWLGYGGERYPRYESVRDGFVAVLDAVRSLTDDPDDTLVPSQWSVRYANRIPQGTVWSTPDDWGFFSLWQPQSLKGLGIEPAGAQARWQLPLEAERGMLNVEFRHDPGDSPETVDCVWINLLTEGPVEAGDTGLFDGLDYGREVIVRAFNELVSPAAKSFWGVAPRSR